MDLTAALGAVSTALGVAKAIKEIDAAYDKAAYKVQIAELMSSLADVKIAVLEGQEELRAKDNEIARLTAAIADKSSLVDGPGGYKWVDRGNGLRLGYPVCPSCLEASGRQVLLKQAGGKISVECPLCDKAFSPVEFFHEPDNQGKQLTETERRENAKASIRRVSSVGIRSDRLW